MPYYPTIQDWADRSSELLRESPTTTRITSKYNIRKPKPPSDRPRKRPRRYGPEGSTDAAAASATETAAAEAEAEPKPEPEPKGTLTLKTYDPVSGRCLKYKTDKAAEVGRIINTMGSLGRSMAGLPELLASEEVKDEELVKETVVEAPPLSPPLGKGATTTAGGRSKVNQPGGEQGTKAGQKGSGTVPAVGGAGGGGGGGKKKKKGKK